MAMTNAERQAAFRERKAAAKIVQVTGLAPLSSRSELLILMKRLVDDPTLEIAVRNAKTGRFERL